MARYFGLGSDQPTENSEKIVADALRKLSDDWLVFHHVSWQSKRSGRQGDGEADFILLHPHKGMLVIEVKGGGVEIEAGRWFTTDRDNLKHPIPNPYEQATASKHALVRWLKERGLASKVRVGHAVIFPHMRTLPWVGPAGTPEITLTKPQLASVDAAIGAIYAHWQLNANLLDNDVHKITNLLAPTISARVGLAAQSEDAEANIILFTAEQIDAFSGLRAHRGGLILGGAGTGKTVLAVARAQQLARDGFRTLLVCYNALLGEGLAARAESPPYLTACTFHTLCLREARRAGLTIPSDRPASWWEEAAPNLLIEACATNETGYDAIVIDEGQDFSPLWFEALRCLVSREADAPFFIFADPLQDIWKRNWSDGSSFPFVWELTRNLRNTQPIAARVAAAVGVACGDKGIPGPEPVWQSTNGSPTEKDVLAAVERLVEEGFGPSNLVVLCSTPSLGAKLRERSVGPFSFGKWGGRGIAVETIARFKGLEAQAVVLVLPDTHNPELNLEAYVGMSRARSVLVVVGPTTSRKSLSWQHFPR